MLRKKCQQTLYYIKTKSFIIKKNGDSMSYLICEECGKYYELNEGKSSFNYDKCDCGGKLTYTDSLKELGKFKPKNENPENCSNCGVKKDEDAVVCSNCGYEFGQNKKLENNRGVSWVGVAIGFGFLMTTTSLAVFAIFGTNIPQKPEDIPTKVITAFGIIAVVVSVLSGLISSYIGGSVNFKNGMINGGLVGVILGLVVGISSGGIAILGAIAVFGSLSVLGGIFGTLLKRRL